MPPRRRPMARGTALRRTGALHRVAMATARRRSGFDRATRALIRDRDSVCQGCGIGPGQAAARGLRLECNHRWASGRGGPDTADNGVLLCGLGNSAGCHRRVDHDRAWALNHGLALHTDIDPASVPVIDWTSARWWLHPDGTRTTARTTSAEPKAAPSSTTPPKTR